MIRLNLRFTGLICFLCFVALSFDSNAGISPKFDFQKRSYPIAYKIYIPAKTLDNGYYSEAKIYEIPKVDKEFYQTNMVYVKTKEYQDVANYTSGFPNYGLQQSLNGLGKIEIAAPFYHSLAENIDYTGLKRVYEVHYNAPVDPYDVCIELMNNPDVEYAVPAFIYYPTYTPNDPRLGNQWLRNKIQLLDAWDVVKGDRNIVIGIADSGIDITHEDLSDNIWTNPDEIPDNNIDDDNNGKIDDVHGWDFIGNITAQQFVSGAFRPDNDVKPVHGSNTHGTHVSGCAAAVTDNGIGIAGPAFNSQILPMKLSCDNVNPNQGGARGILRGYEAILYAAEMGADIINCSWGGPGYTPFGQDVINQVTEMGTLVIVSAGNEYSSLDASPFYPASYDNVMCIGATQSNDVKANYSNYGRKVTVYSPGSSILSTMPGNNYQNQNGTSMASPVTAGVAALVKTVFPNYTPKQIMAQIRSTSDNVLAANEAQRPYLYGRINALKAVTYNNPAYPADKAISVGIIKKEYLRGDSLFDYDNSPVKFTLKNYLYDIGGLEVTIEPLGTFFEVSKTKHIITSMKPGDERALEFTVELKESNPWFFGNASILVTYTAENYIDYELVDIPIRINSENRFSHYFEISSLYGANWHNSSIGKDGTFWMVGQASGDYGVYYKSGIANLFQANNKPLTAAWAFDGSKIIFGSHNTSNQAILLSSNNGGSQFTSQSVDHVTSFVNDVYFFDEMNGVLLGDQKNGKWGVGTTTNAGQTWTLIGNVPLPATGENGFTRASCIQGDNVWFGSNHGNVYYSNDKGLSWKKGTVEPNVLIRSMAFANKDSGIVIYAASSEDPTSRYLASTVDGGKTWTRRRDFSDDNLIPIYAFSAEKTNKLFVVTSGGEVHETYNVGRNWKPVLSYQFSISNLADGISDAKEVKLWMGGSDVTRLSFPYDAELANRKLQVLSDMEIDFDTVDIDFYEQREIEIKNIGDAIVDFTKYEIKNINSNDGEFYTYLATPRDLEAGETKSFKVRFKPQEQGQRSAQLIVYNTSKDSKLTFDLFGVGGEPSSIDYAKVIYNGIKIVPNPVQNTANINFELKNSGNIVIDLIDIKGNIIAELYREFANAGINDMEFDFDSLGSGTYHIRITTNGNILLGKLIISR